MNPKVSIIVPVYNVEKYLRRCLDSLINQTLKEIEIILVEDGSTDNSKIICEEYASKDNRITIIYNEINIKQGLCRNKGIDVARGEYIAFVDSDDWVDFNFYEELYNNTKKEKYDIVKGCRIDVFENKQTKILYINRQIKRNIKRKNRPLFLSFNAEHWSAIYRKDFIVNNNIKYAEEGNAQDLYFLFLACYYVKSIKIVNNVYYYYYRTHKENQNLPDMYYINLLKVSKKIINNLNNFFISKKNYNLIFFYILETNISCYNKLNEMGNDLNGKINEYKNEIFNLFPLYKYFNINKIFEIFNIKIFFFYVIKRKISKFINKIKRIIKMILKIDN